MMTNAAATYARRRYRAMKDAKVCTQCGKAPAAGGKRCCDPCRQKHNAVSQRRQAKLRRLALCLDICSQCLQRQSIRGKKWCGVCAEAHTERQMAKRMAWRAEGRCTRCGGATPCEPCRAIRREKARCYRARLKARGMKQVA